MITDLIYEKEKIDALVKEVKDLLIKDTKYIINKNIKSTSRIERNLDLFNTYFSWDIYPFYKKLCLYYDGINNENAKFYLDNLGKIEYEFLSNILMSDNPIDNIKNNEEIVFKIIPELQKCKGFEQNNPWHVYDVYDHILKVIDGTPKDLSLKIASLFHDLGKPITYIEDDKGVGHFPKHYEKSLDIFTSYLKRFPIDGNTSREVKFLIYNHDYDLEKVDKKNISKDSIYKLLLLKKADLLAQNEKYHYLVEPLEKQIKTLKK